MGLVADLGPGNIAIDTAVFIYFIEENPRFLLSQMTDACPRCQAFVCSNSRRIRNETAPPTSFMGVSKIGSVSVAHPKRRLRFRTKPI